MGPAACTKLEIRAKVKTLHIEQHKEMERKNTLPSILDIESVCDKFEGELFIHAENGWFDRTLCKEGGHIDRDAEAQERHR